MGFLCRRFLFFFFQLIIFSLVSLSRLSCYSSVFDSTLKFFILYRIFVLYECHCAAFLPGRGVAISRRASACWYLRQWNTLMHRWWVASVLWRWRLVTSWNRVDQEDQDSLTSDELTSGWSCIWNIANLPASFSLSLSRILFQLRMHHPFLCRIQPAY